MNDDNVLCLMLLVVICVHGCRVSFLFHFLFLFLCSLRSSTIEKAENESGDHTQMTIKLNEATGVMSIELLDILTTSRGEITIYSYSYNLDLFVLHLSVVQLDTLIVPRCHIELKDRNNIYILDDQRCFC